MRPLLLKGHERPLTHLKYNREGDLLFSCAKDLEPTLWYANDGERIGTYRGHSGAVYSCDVTEDSETLLTASSDTTVKMWEVQTGKERFTFEHKQPARSVSLSVGSHMAAVTTDPFMDSSAALRIYRLAASGEEQRGEEAMRIDMGRSRVTRAVFGQLNKTIIAATEAGELHMIDTETGELTNKVEAHKKGVSDMQMSKERTHLITSSGDKTAKLYDANTLRHLRTYHSDRPLNAATISPVMEHVIIGGGQDAMSVTTTSSKAGKFESKIHHKIFTDDLGSIKGHFGPINALSFSPDGNSYATGGEDGYVRVHFFDEEYFNMTLMEGLSSPKS